MLTLDEPAAATRAGGAAFGAAISGVVDGAILAGNDLVGVGVTRAAVACPRDLGVGLAGAAVVGRRGSVVVVVAARGLVVVRLTACLSGRDRTVVAGECAVTLSRRLWARSA